MKYKRISVITTTEFSDIVSDVLFGFGSAGVAIKDHNDVLESLKSPLNWDYADDAILKNSDPRVFVTGFYEEGTDCQEILNAISALKDDSFFDTGSLETSVGIEDSADWEDVWKQYYKPIPCGKLTIVPKWLAFHNPDTIPVLIDPGLAFGTGNHETTAMCAELLTERSVEGLSVADIGCGSGILGVCALKLGAKQCVFVDIDENAVKAARENSQYNGVENRAKFVLGSFSAGEKQPVDVILANLTADLLVGLKPEAETLLKSGGVIITSGILDGYENRVTTAYSDGFRLLERRQRNHWHAMVWQKL